MELEIWKEIKEFPDYQISNFGRIKSFKRYKEGKILNLVKNSNGYFYIQLYKNGKSENNYIHILLFETFNNYKLKSNECIHHLNEDKSDNIIYNLKLMNKLDHNKLHNSDGTKNFNYGKDHSGMSGPNYGNKHAESSKILMSKNHADVKGENHPRSTLTEQKVIEIWKYLDEGILTQKEIGQMFGVSRSVISKIKNRRNWKHIIKGGN